MPVMSGSAASSSKFSSIESHEGAKDPPALTRQDGDSASKFHLRPPAEKASVKGHFTRIFQNKTGHNKLGDGNGEQTDRSCGFSADGTSSPACSRNASAKSDPIDKEQPRSASEAWSGKRLVARFSMDVEGEDHHEHHLKLRRPQKEFSDSWRSLMDKMLGAQASFVQHVSFTGNNDGLSHQGKDGVSGIKRTAATPSTLVEKYGKCQEIVGRGAFGIVRISHKKAGGSEELYAIKEFRRRPKEDEKGYIKRLAAEFCISRHLNHPNVIATLDLLQDAKGDFCEVMEFCAGGDLFTLIDTRHKLQVQEADCFFKQMIRGVQYLHETGIAHRDLKPENLILTTRGALKITDFGNGECFRQTAWEKDVRTVSGLCGSAPYISPEQYTDKEFDARAVDVWACGVIYMAMRTGRYLWRVAKKHEDEFYAAYLKGRREEEGFAPIESLHDKTKDDSKKRDREKNGQKKNGQDKDDKEEDPERCSNVIYSMLDPHPMRRLTAEQVLNSEWVREIKLCKAGDQGF